MTIETERLQIVEMVDAAQRAVRAAGLPDMIDFEPIGLAQALIFGVRARRRLVSATLAAVPVAALRGATREGPPMIVPKVLGAAVAAPHFPS
jgi:hypothetical protein